ncbi:MAG: DUF3617 family protein [Hyphomicrobiaceae bacterium]|nr:DUF3617 family protein [Hyphomicrobiaceae bacterium]
MALFALLMGRTRPAKSATGAAGRRHLNTGFHAAAVAAACMLTVLPVHAADATLPMRKAGLWELVTAMDEGGGPRESTFTMCIGAEMEQVSVATSIAQHQDNCARYVIKKEGGNVVVDADCKFDRANVISTTRMSGDFQSAFEVKIESTTVAGGGGQSRAVKRTIDQSGKYLGADCGELQPGQARTADGSTVFVQ